MGAVKSMGSDAGDPMTKSRASAAFCDGSGRFVPDHFTEPVIPSANCFCRTKKTMIVGSEQNSTPSISMP